MEPMEQALQDIRDLREIVLCLISQDEASASFCRSAIKRLRERSEIPQLEQPLDVGRDRKARPVKRNR